MDLKAKQLMRRQELQARPAKPLHVGCNYVLFSAHLVREDRFSLRFDPRFNQTGGQDTDFFTRA